MRKTISAHMIVKNEEKWIWYSIMSVIEYVDKMIIFDTGSTDNTVKIINSIISQDKYQKKITFEMKGDADNRRFTQLRQEQIERTNTDYFLVVDGDEIWYKKSMEEISDLINGDKNVYLAATKFINCAGDVYHYRDFNRENYNIKGITGSITIRLFSMDIDGIHCAGDYGVEGYYDKYGKPVQDSIWDIEIMKNLYLHMSLLQRSASVKNDWEIKYRRKKILADWDYRFEKSFMYPEVFYIDKPNFVESPWEYKIDFYRKTIHKLKKAKNILNL